MTYQRMSPGMYRGPNGQMVRSAQMPSRPHAPAMAFPGPQPLQPGYNPSQYANAVMQGGMQDMMYRFPPGQQPNMGQMANAVAGHAANGAQGPQGYNVPPNFINYPSDPSQIDPGFSRPGANLREAFGRATGQPQPPPRSQTVSPGIGMNGQPLPQGRPQQPQQPAPMQRPPNQAPDYGFGPGLAPQRPQGNILERLGQKWERSQQKQRQAPQGIMSAPPKRRR